MAGLVPTFRVFYSVGEEDVDAYADPFTQTRVGEAASAGIPHKPTRVLETF